MVWLATFRGFTVVTKNRYHWLIHSSRFWLLLYSGMMR